MAVAYGVLRPWRSMQLLSGILPQQLVNRVLAKNTALINFETNMAGISGRHKDAVSTLLDAQSVLGYDWRAGWP